MIQISYSVGEVSLSSAIAAGKQLIMHRKDGTCCRIQQHSNDMVIAVNLVVDVNGVIDEEVVATPKQRQSERTTIAYITDAMVGQTVPIDDDRKYVYDPDKYVIRDGVISRRTPPSK